MPGPSPTGSVANGGGAATSGETKSRNHGKAAYGKDMAIIEVTNDGIPENMEMLIHLKEIFHQQLPKMPKEYIVRLVFDRNHHSIVLTKQGVPIGGITYRPFVEQKFGEIAFCAVASNCQVQGYGSRLMNELKMVAIREDLSHFHTYADNFAIGYFSKHGFTKNLTMSRDRWLNYVKDYDGGTHMECYVHPTVPFMDQAEMFEMQGQFLRERIADISSSKVVYPGLTEDVINNLEHPIDIPGVAEAGWTVDELNAQNRRKRDVDAQAVHKELLSIWRELEKHDSAWVFREPVDPAEVTDYLSIIKQPMDLSLIRENLDDVDPTPVYKDKATFRQHLDLMVVNCKRYNGEDTEFWEAADSMEKAIADIFARKQGGVEGSSGGATKG
eukprot:g12665.t1